MPKLTNLSVEWVSLVNRAAVRDPANPTEPQRFLVWKADSGATHEGGDMPEVDELRTALAKTETEREELRKQLEDQTTVKAALAKAEQEIEALKKATSESDDDEDDKKDDVSKADLSPAVRARLEKLEKAEADATARLKKAEENAEESAKLAKAERDQRVEREFIVKAEGYQALSLDPSKFGPILKRASDSLSKEDYDEVERLLKAADEQISQGALFAERGRGGEPEHVSGADELTRKAEEIRKADPSVSEYEAMRQAMQTDRKAQSAYLQAVR